MSRGGAAIDWSQVGSILRATLRMRLRVGGGVRLGRSAKPRGLIAILVLYGLGGFLIGSLAFAHLDVFTYAAFILAMTLLFTGSVVVAESSQILFNPHEADLLGHRPIAPRTLLVAKILDVLALALSIVLVLSLGPLILSAVAGGLPRWFPLAHLLVSVLTAVFVAGAMVFCYAALMKLVGRERLDGFLAWWQIAITMVMVFGYQVIPRMVDRAKGFRLDPAAPGLFLLPPAWFAALESLLTGSAPTALLVGMAATAVVVTAVLPLLAVGRLASDYAGGFSALSETSASPPAREQVRTVQTPGILAPILRAWMRDPVERGVFDLASIAMRRDRDVRMRLYPSVATPVVFAFLPLIDRGHSISGPILSLAMLGMLTTSSMETLRFSPQYAAADVFRYAPLEGTAAVFHGTRKAVLVGYVLPVFALLVPILFFTIHDRQKLLVTIPVLMALPTLSLIGGLAGNYLPLSVAPAMGRQTLNQIVTMIGGALLSALIAGLAFAALKFGWFLPMIGVELALLAGFHALLLKGIRARSLDPVD